VTTILTINGKHYISDADPNTPLLWVLRDHLNLTGTKGLAAALGHPVQKAWIAEQVPQCG
jgi:aerobic-type carbon monoxide dehydrogenase small subunit (CoxS/CutS family)